MESFATADAEIKKIVLEYAGELQVATCKEMLDAEGNYRVEIPHYSQENNEIRMDEGKDTEEYVMTFRHEYGHFADEQMGRPSLQEDFDMAIQADFSWYDRNTDYGSKNLENFLINIENSAAFDSRYFSDILSGIFHNDRVICDFYESNGVAFYGHTNYYWLGLKGPEKAVQREVFANLFAIYTENDREIVSFVEKSFPNITKQFRRALGGVNAK